MSRYAPDFLGQAFGLFLGVQGVRVNDGGERTGARGRAAGAVDAKAKTDVVLRLLRRESVGAVSREL